MFAKKIVLIGIALVLLVFFGYLAYRKITQPKNIVTNPEIPLSIASGRYSEFLKETLKLEVKIDAGSVWIFITNKSPTEYMPSEESHRSIVCTTEIIEPDNKIKNSFKEYFKRPPPSVEGYVPNMQIAPNTTEKFAYDLYLPHGTVRVNVTYVDFSVIDEKDGGTIFLTQQEVKF